jgi:hypothetical protein
MVIIFLFSDIGSGVETPFDEAKADRWPYPS